MPNYAPISNDPLDLRVQIFGSSATEPVSVDAAGKLQIKAVEDAINVNNVNSVTGTVTVQGTNLDIRPLTSSDAVSIHGSNGGAPTPISVDGSGRLDVRNLTNATDSVAIYGTDGSANRQILVDAQGRLQVSASGSSERSTEYSNLSTTDTYAYTEFINVVNYKEYVYYVRNTGTTNAATVIVQISPTELEADVIDHILVNLDQGAKEILIPTKFLYYIRLGYRSAVSGSPTTINAFFQARA